MSRKQGAIKKKGKPGGPTFAEWLNAPVAVKNLPEKAKKNKAKK